MNNSQGRCTLGKENDTVKTAAISHNCLPDSISRVVPFTCLLFFLVACSQATPAHTGSPPSSPGNSSLQLLQRRALHLPSLKPGTPCPTTHGSFVIPNFDPLLGKGPVYADFFGGKPQAETTEKGILDYVSSFGDESQWGGQKVIWFIDPAYRGPVLIRSGQINGVHKVRFNGGIEQQNYSSPSIEQNLNGCCYGRDNTPDKGDYLKLCGQEFWSFISGDDDLYVRIIEPLDEEARKKDEQFKIAYGRQVNILTSQFIDGFCDSGDIDWIRLLQFVSSRARPQKVTRVGKKP